MAAVLFATTATLIATCGQTFLFGVTPTDPLLFTAVTLVLLAVGLVTAWPPARRATRIDPWTALRAE